MPLHITLTAGRQLAGQPTLDALRNDLASHGHAVLLVPSFAQALRVQRFLADQEGLALGVTVTTPNAWTDERWQAWGDGRHLVTDTERLILMRLALDAFQGPLPTTDGMLDALCSVARQALPLQMAGAQLTEGEQAACAVLASYEELLAQRGLVERCEVLRVLATSMEGFEPLVVSGFATLQGPLRALLLAVARQASVQVVATRIAGQGQALAQVLREDAQAAGIACTVEEEPAEASGVAQDELQALKAALARGRDGYGVVESRGAVRRARPAGPLAQWELVAQEVALLQAKGCSQIVVAVADVQDAWHGLAPKLAARGVGVSCATKRKVAQDVTATAFFGFAETVALLSQLAQSWPAPVNTPAGKVPQLGDMSWWPPRKLTDFLLSAASQVEASHAWDLDARWRGNRTLTPQQVLDQLQRESLTSKVVAQATASVLRGRVGTAALQLARSLEEAPGNHQEQLDMLACIQDAARTIGAMGISAAHKQGVRVTLPLPALVALVKAVAQRLSVVGRRHVGPSDGCQVSLCSRQEASTLPCASADALVVCGMTAEEWSLSPKDDAATGLLQKLGLDQPEEPLAVARRQFHGMLEVPTQAVVLVDAQHNSAAQPTYPAVMLSEALACYPDEGKELPGSALGEGGADALLAASGTEAAATQSLSVAPAGQVGQAAAGMVVVPREGQDALPGGVPSLSASQIESYLECPYKWFTLRRLGLGDNDATFSPVQMGSFAHRVLEVSRRMLLQQAAQEQGLVAPGELLDLDGADAAYVQGSAISEQNLALAQQLVNTEFDYHLAHQRQKATAISAQALVPHSATEEYRLDLLRQDLLSEVAFEIGHFKGFAPRYFELRFGGTGQGARHVTYAGADFVGTIDRVDVDSHGRALVIDYKHKSATGFASEYDAFAEESPDTPEALELPRRVQSLIYAQIVRRMYPNLKVIGAVYLSTQGGPRRQHEIAGVLDANAADMVMGSSLSDKRWAHLVAGGLGKLSFEELLDETERRIAQKIAQLAQGQIQAEPVDKHACTWCPVANCERRLV